MKKFAQKTSQDLYNDRKLQSAQGLNVSTNMNDYKKMYGDLTGMAYNYKRTDNPKTYWDTQEENTTPTQTITNPDLSAYYAQQLAAQQAAYEKQLAEQRAREAEAARQRQQAAQAAYTKNMAYLNDAYAKRGDLLQQNYAGTQSQLQGQYDYGAQGVNQNADRAQQQAYINYMMSKRDLPQQLSALGINGGASESRLAGLYNSYGNARNEVDAGRNSDLAMLRNTLNQNLAGADQTYKNQLANDAAQKLAYQMQLEQNRDNAVADIISQYGPVEGLDSLYTAEMEKLAQSQADAAQKAQATAYSAANAPVSADTQQVADALRAQGAKVYQTAYQKAAQDGYTQVASSRAEQAMKSFYYEMYRSGVMDEETYELLTR